MSELAQLKKRHATAVERRESALLVYHKRAAEARELGEAIRAIEHPPRKPDRGIRDDDDLSFLHKRKRFPRDPAARHLEQKRRYRIRETIKAAAWKIYKEEPRELLHKPGSMIPWPTDKEMFELLNREDVRGLCFGLAQ